MRCTAFSLSGEMGLYLGFTWKVLYSWPRLYLRYASPLNTHATIHALYWPPVLGRFPRNPCKIPSTAFKSAHVAGARQVFAGAKPDHFQGVKRTGEGRTFPPLGEGRRRKPFSGEEALGWPWRAFSGPRLGVYLPLPSIGLYGLPYVTTGHWGRAPSLPCEGPRSLGMGRDLNGGEGRTKKGDLNAEGC